MRKNALSISSRVAVLLVISFTFVAQAHAGWLGPGCWNCESSSGWNANKRCNLAGHEENGTGTNCYRGDDLMGEWCYTNGVFCHNTDVSGGGGGGGGVGGGGGGSTCTVAPSAGCPAECMSCNTRTY